MRAFAHRYNKGVNRGTPMPMPSLFRYFLVVGSALTGLLLLANHMLEPPAAAVAAVAPAKIVVRHDPRASIIERWRNEQAARKAAERGEPAAPVIAAAAPEPATPVSEPSPTRPEPPQIVAPVALHTAPAAAAAVPDAAAEARKAEQERAAQARKARITRERARAKRQEKQQEQQQEAASRQQDQFYYGASRRAYAEPPAFAPFGGRTW